MSKIQVGDVWEGKSSGCHTTVLAVANVMAICSSNDPDMDAEFTMVINAALFQLASYGKLIERDGKPVKPEPQTLEERVQAAYPGYEVVMLDFWENKSTPNSRDYLGFRDNARIKHIQAQSMKGFFQYAYLIDGSLRVDRLPTWPSMNETIHPIAALFSEVADV